MWIEEIHFDEKIPVSEKSLRFSLHEPKVWLVESGSIDLFAIEKVDGKGTHYFLKEFQKDSLIFGFSNTPSKYEIVAVAEPKTIFSSVSIDSFFSEISQKPELLNAVIPHFNTFHGGLPSLFLRHRKIKEAKLLLASQKEPFRVQKGERIMFEHLIGEEDERRINWVKIEKGKLCLLGWKEVCMKEGSFLPLRTDLWWSALEDSILTAISPIKLIQEGSWKMALSQFQEWFLNAIEMASAEAHLREVELMEKREKLEETLLKQSFGALTSVLTREEIKMEEGTQNPLFLACSLIGKKLNIEFTEPKGKEPSVNYLRHLIEMCEASKIRYRRVSLDEKWWKEPGDPYLSFYGKNHRPVALISDLKGKYEMIDPITSQKSVVDEKVAKEIVSFGFCFFSSFSNDSLTFKDVLKFGFRNEKGKLSLVFFTGLAISFLGIFLPLASKIIFGVAIPQLNHKLLWQVGVGIFLAAISSFLYQLSQGFLIFHISTVGGNRIEYAEWDRILKLPVAFFKKISVGDLWSRISGITSLRKLFNNYYILLILSAFFSVVYVIVMCFFSLSLTIVGVLITAVSLLGFVLFLPMLANRQKNSYQLKGNLNGFIIQVISGIHKIRVSASEKRVFSYWAKNYAEAKKNDLEGQNLNTAIATIFSVTPFFSYLGIFLMVIYYVLAEGGKHQISTGNFFGFITAFGAFLAAIVGSVPAITNLYRIVEPISARLEPIFHEKIEDSEKKIFAGPLEGHIVIDQVSFSYDPNGPLILKDVTIRAKTGEFIGIAGPTGSGKSTLIRLLLGFDVPQKGTVFYDGNDLAHLDLGSVRRQIGVVLQHGSILGGTIYDNLVFGGIYTKEQVERAIHLSGFNEDLNHFPMGLYTALPSGGGTLSAGQKQRLLIARALISNPKILLFDEATSSFDTKMQEKLSQNIEKLNVTRIVIAHRLVTIRHADRIYIMDKGEVIDSGTYKELVSKPGLFAEYVDKQKIDLLQNE